MVLTDGFSGVRDPCLDPESFARGGPTLMCFFFFGGGGGGVVVVFCSC